MLAIAAALAVLFECTPFLRGGFGNVAFFFLWLFALTIYTEQFQGVTLDYISNIAPRNSRQIRIG